MKRVVTYLAAEKQAGFTAEEMRDALTRATGIQRVWCGWRGKPWRIDVEEPTDPDVKIGLS